MENAITRNSGSTIFIAKHLYASALAALRDTQQVNAAGRLGVASSTVQRRTDKYPEVMENLAASGIEDFVMRGEKKIPEDEYRILIKYAMNWMAAQAKKETSAATEA